MHPTAAAVASQSARQRPQPLQYGRMSLGDLGREQQPQPPPPNAGSYDDQLMSWERERSTR